MIDSENYVGEIRFKRNIFSFNILVDPSSFNIQVDPSSVISGKDFLQAKIHQEWEGEAMISEIREEVQDYNKYIFWYFQWIHKRIHFSVWITYSVRFVFYSSFSNTFSNSMHALELHLYLQTLCTGSWGKVAKGEVFAKCQNLYLIDMTMQN